MTHPARDESDVEPDLTPEERAQLRALLRLIRRGGADVDARPAQKVRRTREPPPEAFERVSKMRRRKGLRNG